MKKGGQKRIIFGAENFRCKQLIYGSNTKKTGRLISKSAGIGTLIHTNSF